MKILTPVLLSPSLTMTMVPMTIQLDATSGMTAFFAELQADETVRAAVDAGVEEAVQAVALMARTARVWERQLGEQRQERDTRLERGQRSSHAAGPVMKGKKAKDPMLVAQEWNEKLIFAAMTNKPEKM